MTTAAYKDGILAVDSKVTCGRTKVATATKLFASPNGDRVAVSGELTAMAEYKVWADEGCDPEKVPDPVGDTSALWVKLDGTVLVVEAGNAFPINGPFHAVGSGTDIALGAMAAGASAEMAVQIACEYDTATGYPVLVATIKAVADDKKEPSEAVILAFPAQGVVSDTTA